MWPFTRHQNGPTRGVSETKGHCWRSRPLRDKRGEAGDACGGKWAIGEPCPKAVNIDRRSRCHVLQMCLGEPAVARPSQAERAGRLRNRALDTLSLGIELAACLARQARPCRRECLVLLARMQGQLSAPSLRLRAAGFGWADLTVAWAEADADIAPARLVRILAPGRAHVPLRALRARLLPVDRELGSAEGPLGAGLPAHVLPRWADQVDAEARMGCDELTGADVARIDQVLDRHQALIGQRHVDRLGARRLVYVGRCRVSMDHEPRRLRVTGLGDMDHVAGPARAALGPEPCLDVVGRLDAVARAATLHRP